MNPLHIQKQAERIGCIAELLQRANKRANEYNQLGFMSSGHAYKLESDEKYQERKEKEANVARRIERYLAYSIEKLTTLT
jgi:hypothetical protein